MPSYIVPHHLAQVEYDNVCPPSDLDILCKDSVDLQLGEQGRAAKRVRIEQYATNYLLGNPPLIKSASLRGPFTNKWVNPWNSQATQQVSASPCLNKDHRAIKLEIKSSNGEREVNRLIQQAAGSSEPSTNQGTHTKQLTPISLQPKPAQIITVLADANGKWHCPVPNCPIASRAYRLERHLANHVSSKHGDSILINFTYVSPQSNFLTRQLTGKHRFPPTDTSSPTNPNTTSPSPPNTNPNATSRPQCNEAIAAFQERIRKFENAQTIQQHRNAIISGPEDREKLMRALRESGAIVTSLSARSPNASNDWSQVDGKGR